ncbi:nucleotide exchange factor GrpE [Crenobacter sp. SG2303]|uniref:Protein GrpE n=1 Tax=Crenobacter oryzisoli TaxID=3056844 RepID=A0ABT7XM85_9NEIS|nr:nucleotide exchange factor GrpE [Crenobacter sp. SG2303]MDN0074899.1 nucleotide exchange factor GrpE [Crenobacter sp. SG2303]
MQENENSKQGAVDAADIAIDKLAEAAGVEASDDATRIAELEKEVAELKDNFLRARADADNLRRRATEDVQNARKFAINKFAGELLSVKDSLEMALADQSGQFDALKFGVDLTLKQLASAFDKADISEVNPIGEKLDPHKHQAISAEESDAEPNTVIRVMQKGYTVADRVLRPAMVVVAKAKA